MIAFSGHARHACIVLLFLNLPGFARAHEAKEIRIVRNTDVGLWDADADTGRRIDFIEDLVLGGEGKENETFGRISDVAVNARGDIYILDFGLKRVHVFDSTGTFLLSFGGEGNGPGELSFPSAIHIDEYDEVFVADEGEVEVFDLDGGYSKSFPVEVKGPITGLGKDSGGNMFLAYFEIFDQNIIHKYDYNGALLLSFCDSYAKGADIDVRIEYTFAGGRFDIGAGDVIYYSQKLPYEIRTFDCDGDLLSCIYRESSFMKPPDEYVERNGDNLKFSMPNFSSSIVVLPDGMFMNSVLVVEDSERSSTVIDVFDSAGRLLTTKTDERPIFFGCSDRNGSVYAVDNGEYARVIRFEVLMR